MIKRFGVALGLLAALALSACKGKEGPAGPAGSSYTPPGQLCGNPSIKGVTLTTLNETTRYGGQIAANAVTITSATTAISLSIYTRSGPVTGQIRMALYGDTGSNSPGNLIAESNPFVPATSSWNTVDIADTYLPVGTYWLAMNYSNDNTQASSWVATGTIVWLTSYGWAKFPATFGTPSGTNAAAQFSMYINTCP